MSKGTRVFFTVVFLLFVFAVGWIGFLHFWRGPVSAGDSAGTENEQADANAVARVKVAHVKLAIMHKTITAYGNVFAAPENTRVSMVSFESKVSRVMVTPGQRVASGSILVEVEPSYEAMLQLEEAKSAQKTALLDAEQAQKRLDLKLGTYQELAQAQRTLELAQTRLASLEHRGIGNVQVTAQTEGLVSKINAQPGQVVPEGSSLIEIVAGDKLEVLLGVEPADANKIQRGLDVEIRNINAADSNSITGTVRLVAQRINPSTRLVDVFVALPPGCPLLQDSYVCGKIIVDSRQTLVVPRSAILIDGEHYNIFTVKDDKAVKYTVGVGIEDNQQVEVITDKLKADDPVVVEGNYELEEGMAVNIEDAR